MQDNVLITLRKQIVWSHLVTNENANHHLGVNNLYNIHGSAIWMLCLEAQIYVLWQTKKGAEKRDEMVVVFPLCKRLFIPCSYLIQEVKS